MRRIFAIAKLNLLELVRDRGEIVGVIVLPLLLTWVFGTAFGNAGASRPLEIPLADQDGSSYSRRIVESIDAAEGFAVQRSAEKLARAAVKEGDRALAVVIPKGFGAAVEAGRPIDIEVIRDPSSMNAQAAATVVEGAAAEVAADAKAARIAQTLVPATVPAAPPVSFADAYAFAQGLREPEPPVGVSVEVVAASKTRAAELGAPANTQYSLGFTVFFVFMVALGSAGGVLEERELGTLRRILSAPVRRAEILCGKVLGVALVASFEAAMLVGFGAFVFGVPWGSDPGAVAILLVALVLAATGLGVMVSAFVRTRSQLSALTPVLSTALAMLGGCYWPIEITSPFMRRLALFTPTGWAMSGLKDVVARGMGLEAVVAPVAVLVGFATVALLLGVSRLRLE